jgi:hypothetical protein
MAGLEEALPLFKGRASRAAIIVHINFLFASVKCISHWLGFLVVPSRSLAIIPKIDSKLIGSMFVKKTGENSPQN